MKIHISSLKRKGRQKTLSDSSQESSPVSKKTKNLSFSSIEQDQVMAASNPTEGQAEKVDLIIMKLCKLEKKIDEVNKEIDYSLTLDEEVIQTI